MLEYFFAVALDFSACVRPPDAYGGSVMTASNVLGGKLSSTVSRLGRNSALTGLYTNFTFPQYGVRYIAINDNFDTINPNSTDNETTCTFVSGL